MGKYEDLLEQVKSYDEDLATDLGSFAGSTLRKKAEERDAIARERDELQSRIEKMEKAPEKQKAFQDYGVEIDALKPLERQAIEAYEGDLDEDAIAEFVSTNDLSVSRSEEGEEEPEAGKVVRQATTGTGTPGGGQTTLKPEAVREWPIDKMQRFMKEHPQEWEHLKRGETVVGVGFS